MKTIQFTFCLAIFCLLTVAVYAQDPTDKLKEAETAYASKNLENTRFALQAALVEINKAISKELLDILPKKMNDLPYNEKDDNLNGAAGFAGVFVNRSFGTLNQTGTLEIMSDSPMLTALNAILSLPAIMGASDPNQKRLKIGGYKSLLQKETGNNNSISYTLQIPINNTLITLRTKGFPSENDITNFAGSLQLDQIARITK